MSERIASKVILTLHDLTEHVASDFSSAVPGEDAISVTAVGGDWINAGGNLQRKTRRIRIDCRASTAEASMLLSEKARMRVLQNFTVTDISDIRGGYDYDSRAHFQTTDFSIRGSG